MSFDANLATRAAAHASAYLATIGDRLVRASLTSDQLRERLGGPLPDHSDDPINVLDAIADAGRTGTVASRGALCGFVPAAFRPRAAHWRVSAWDQTRRFSSCRPWRPSSEMRPGG
jgi:hypothetical protein